MMYSQKNIKLYLYVRNLYWYKVSISQNLSDKTKKFMWSPVALSRINLKTEFTGWLTRHLHTQLHMLNSNGSLITAKGCYIIIIICNPE
jgi:hypothetical protein